MTVFAPSPDGKWIVAGGTDGQAQVLEVIEHANAASRVSHDRTWIAKGKEIALRGHVGDLTDAAFVSRSRCRSRSLQGRGPDGIVYSCAVPVE